MHVQSMPTIDEAVPPHEATAPGLTETELQAVMAAAAVVDASTTGVIAGAVLAAARNSAGMSTQELARRAGVSPQIVTGWEDGTRPLCALVPDQLTRVETALSQAGADPGIVADLPIASECDMLVAGLVHGLELLPADVPSADEDDARTRARELLGWAITGLVPQRYAAYPRHARH
ncbi:MAG TPA: helix-turn-helix transcriptional regulator [Streptosporangiaceae bacterium]|nr:helix-turn-helix transcriptional regulator [Streptosporangiaceae bacterium]